MKEQEQGEIARAKRPTARRMEISAQDIIIPPYQRENVPESVINARASLYEPDALRPLLVAHRDGKYYAVDGAQRMRLWRQLGLQGRIPCDVFESTGIEHEARVFKIVNEQVTRVSAIDSFKAGVLACTQPETEINDAINRLGMRITAHGYKENEIDFVTTLRRAWNADKKAAHIALCVGRRLADPDAMHNITFKAVWYLEHHGVSVGNYVDRINAKGGQAKVEKMARMSALEAGHNNVNGRTAALGLLRIINHRLRHKVILPQD